MITRFEIQNYKALRDVAIDLTPIHVLIGPNDSGKTSILEALQILSAGYDGDSVVTAFPVRNLEHLHSFGMLEQPVTIKCRIVSESPHKYELTCRFILQEGTRWFFEKEARILPGGVSEKALLDASLLGIQTYRWIPRHLALPVGLNADRKYRMDESGFGLPTLLDDILSCDRRRFDELERRFQEIFPEVESLSTPTQKGYAVHPSNGSEAPDVDGKGLEFKFKHIEKPLSAMSVSDGYLIVLAYLALLHTPQPPPMLLIEEPENGMHPKRLGEIVKMLRSLTEREGGPQILLTTHSPYLLDQFEPKEVTLCTKGADGTISTMRMSESETVQKQKGVFTLGEIWGGEGEDGILGRRKVDRAASE